MATRSNSVNQWIDMAGEYFKRLPELPKGGRDAVVTIVPWLALVFGGFGTVFGGLALIGASIFPSAMFFMGRGAVGQGIFLILLSLISSVLMLAAFPGAKSQKEKGWRLLYYSEVVSLVSSIVTLNLVGVLFNLIGFYFLYQIRSYYK